MKKDYFFERRTIRKFDSRPVSKELIVSIIERAAKAPTTGNMQLYSVIETRSEEGLRSLASLHFNQPAAAGAPLILTVCADLYRFTRWCRLSDANVGFDNFMTFLYAFSDAMILTQQIVTIAEMEGLGTCYLGTVLSNTPEIASLLGLPKGVIPVASISVGWPAEEGEPTERLRTADILHSESYRKDTDEDIIEIFKVKEEYAPNRKFVEENGKKNLAQVFAEVRYPGEINEASARKFLEYLKENNCI